METANDIESIDPPRAGRASMHPRLWQILFAVSVLLLAGSVYRAATYPFVHDESLSFAIFTWEPAFREVASHHWLNTWLMEASARMLGSTELALRLPNLLGHLVYLGCGLALLCKLRHSALQGGGFVAMQMNPFVLDYFCLARGYGLALAGMAASLWMLAVGVEERALTRRRWWVLGSIAAGALTVLANFSFLFFFVALLAVVAALCFPRGFRRVPGLAVAVLLCSGVFSGLVLSHLGSLAKRGELYFGGTHGFLQDTVGSLVECSLYRAPYASVVAGFLSLAATVVLAIVCGAGLWWAARRRCVGLGVAFTFLLAGSALLPIVGHALGRSLFPIERGALSFVPLAVAALAFSMADLRRGFPARWMDRGLNVGAGATVVLGTLHFALTYNLLTSHTWAYDANNRAVLELIVRDHLSRKTAAEPRLAVDWLFLPSFTFYRVTGPGSWLAPLARVNDRRGDEQYAYVFDADATPLLARQYSVMARFPDTRTMLLRHD